MEQSKGMLKAVNMTCVQVKKNLIGDSGDYFYDLGFSDGENLLVCTAGKIGDGVKMLTVYDLGFDFLNKKLKLVSVVPRK